MLPSGLGTFSLLDSSETAVAPEMHTTEKLLSIFALYSEF